MTRTFRTAAALVAAVLVAGTAACGDDDDADSGDTSAETTTTVEEPAESAAEAAGWETHEGGEDCECADGSDFVYFSRTADPERVVLYFQGGGACFSAETCSFEDGTYKVTTGAEDDPTGAAGIFDFEEEDNPFRDWSMVYVPYCTGDVHIGDATTEYSPELTVEHNGFANASAGLDFLVEEFPDATEVFVTGSSAGGVPAPLFGGLVTDELPDADVAVLADASGGYASNPLVNETIGALWNSDAAIPDWSVVDDDVTYGIPDLFTLTAAHSPDVRFARFDRSFDEVQRTFVALTGGGDGDLPSVLDQNEELVEGSGTELSVFVAPGSDHTILPTDAVYDLTVDGVSFLDWLTSFVSGEQPGDVRCTDCGAPTSTTTAPG